jgi:hypothetical protein
MAAVEGLALGPDGMFRTTYRGVVLVLPPEQAERVRVAARAQLVRGVRRSNIRADTAIDLYRSQEQVNRDFWGFSHVVKAWAYARSLGGYSDPGTALSALRVVKDAEAAAALQAAGAGAFAVAAAHLAKADETSERIAMLVRVYREQLIEGGQSLATVLEYTRDAAFATLGVLAVVVSGGAAAGVAPTVLGTGVGGLGVAGTATAVSVGAPLVAAVGEAGVRNWQGETVDWATLGTEAAVQVVLARAGGRLGQTVLSRLAGNPAAQTVARRAFAAVASGVVTHEAGQAISVTVHGAVNALRGRPASWAQLTAELERRLTDPTGLLMAALASGISLGANQAVARARAGSAARAAPAPSAPGALAPPAGREAPAAGTPRASASAPAPAAPTPAPSAEPVTAPSVTSAAGAVAAPPAPKATAPSPPVSGPTAGTPVRAPKQSLTRRGGPPGVAPGPFGARPPGSRSRFHEGEGAVEALQAGRGSLPERVLEERGTRVDTTPGRSGGRRPRPSAKAHGQAQGTTGSSSVKAPAAGTKPFAERVLVGDLENGRPTGVVGELVPSDLHTGSRSSSDVNPLGLTTGELDPLGARRGHLLGNQFGGSGRDLGNLAWMHERINNSDFKMGFENPLRKALKSGRSVRFGVRPKYRGDEMAPHAVEVWATGTDGQVVVPRHDIPTPGLSDVVLVPE